MKKNMGTTDKIVRITLAFVIAGLYITGIINGIIAIVGLFLAAVFILTSFIGTCPLYLPFGLSTLRNKLK